MIVGQNRLFRRAVRTSCSFVYTKIVILVYYQRILKIHWGFPGGSDGKESAWVVSLGREYPLEEGMATHSSILAWRIPWTEEPGGL